MKVLIKERLSPHKSKTPEGYLICQDAILARTGKQEYLKSELYPESDSDEIIEVDRKANQVFAPETLASFENKPVTVEHPQETVTPENFRDLAVGFVRDIKQGKVDGQDVILGNLIITDAETIENIEKGIRTELSCGYDCDITDGDHPEQVNIRGNHVALCEQGRAGIAKIVDSSSTVEAAKATTAVKDEPIDMAMPRDKAISLCIDLGKMFIKHFDKIYKSNDAELIGHWIKEMNAWYNKVKELKLKENKTPIKKGDLKDWFFDAGANPEDFMEKPTIEEIDAYDDFEFAVLSGSTISEAILEMKKNFKLFHDADPKQELIKSLQRLMKEEQEAISSYQQAINETMNVEGAEDLFRHIQKEEQEHLDELNKSLINGEPEILDSSTDAKASVEDEEVEDVYIEDKDFLQLALNWCKKLEENLKEKNPKSTTKYTVKQGSKWIRILENGETVAFIDDKGKIYLADTATRPFDEQRGDITQPPLSIAELKKYKMKKDSDDGYRYVVYKENGKLKGTNYENYIAGIRDANKVVDLKDFETFEDAVKYLTKHTSLQAQNIMNGAEVEGEEMKKDSVIEDKRTTCYLCGEVFEDDKDPRRRLMQVGEERFDSAVPICNHCLVELKENHIPYETLSDLYAQREWAKNHAEENQRKIDKLIQKYGLYKGTEEARELGYYDSKYSKGFYEKKKKILEEKLKEMDDEDVDFDVEEDKKNFTEAKKKAKKTIEKDLKDAVPFGGCLVQELHPEDDPEEIEAEIVSKQREEIENKGCIKYGKYIICKNSDGSYRVDEIPKRFYDIEEAKLYIDLLDEERAEPLFKDEGIDFEELDDDDLIGEDPIDKFITPAEDMYDGLYRQIEKEGYGVYKDYYIYKNEFDNYDVENENNNCSLLEAMEYVDNEIKKDLEIPNLVFEDAKLGDMIVIKDAAINPKNSELLLNRSQMLVVDSKLKLIGRKPVWKTTKIGDTTYYKLENKYFYKIIK